MKIIGYVNLEAIKAGKMTSKIHTNKGLAKIAANRTKAELEAKRKEKLEAKRKADQAKLDALREKLLS